MKIKCDGCLLSLSMYFYMREIKFCTENQKINFQTKFNTGKIQNIKLESVLPLC